MEFLSLLPVITMCVVGILLLIVVSVVLATNRVRPKQAWQGDEENAQEPSSYTCCRRNTVRPIHEDNISNRQTHAATKVQDPLYRGTRTTHTSDAREQSHSEEVAIISENEKDLVAAPVMEDSSQSDIGATPHNEPIKNDLVEIEWHKATPSPDKSQEEEQLDRHTEDVAIFKDEEDETSISEISEEECEASIGSNDATDQNQSISTRNNQKPAKPISVSGPTQEEELYEWQQAKQLIEKFKATKDKQLDSRILCNNHTYLCVDRFCASVQADSAERIWISNSPKRNKSDKLIQHFQDCRRKPIIYIGRVFQYTSSDRQGLKELMRAGFRLEVWQNISENIYERYDIHIQQYINCTKDELDECPDNERNYYTEEQVSSIALGEIGVTHLLTNSGKMYRSTLKCHAEEVFINDYHNQQNLNVGDVTTIWIKSSPCWECSIKLQDSFGPHANISVYIGHIFRLEDDQDFCGMVELAVNNFHFEIWENFNRDKYGWINEKTKSYLANVKKKAKTKRQKQSGGHFI